MDHNANTFRAAPGVAASSDALGTVLFHAREGRLFNLNRTGTQIWRGIEQQLPFDRLVADLSEQRSVAEEVVAMHTRRFIDALRRNHLIEEA